MCSACRADLATCERIHVHVAQCMCRPHWLRTPGALGCYMRFQVAAASFKLPRPPRHVDSNVIAFCGTHMQTMHLPATHQEQAALARTSKKT
jgi:Zn-finger nucleic acid-binding protein